MESNQRETITQSKLFPESIYSQLTSSPSINDISVTKQYRRVNHISKFKPFHEFQNPLVGISHEAFLDYIDTAIPADHLCRLVKEVVFSLDTERIEAKYSFNGQKTYHPKLMMSLLFYGYATGVRSSRNLEEKCIRDQTYYI